MVMNAHRTSTNAPGRSLRCALRARVRAAFSVLGTALAMGLAMTLAMGLAPQAAATVVIDNLRDMDLGTWSPGSGNAAASQDFCVQSDFFFGFFIVDWAARLDDLSGASTTTQFRIANGAGSDALTVNVRLVDLRTSVSQMLMPGVQTPATQTGDTARCPRGLNGRIEVSIDAAELAAARAGRFEGTFEFRATRSGSDSDTFRIRVDVPDLVRVSGLDDIALGLYPGAGDLVGADALCVYRNDPSSRYEIEAGGQGAGRAFELRQGAAVLPFEVDYDDGSGFARLEAGRALRASGADTRSPSCGGLGTGNVRVRVREADLATADAGSYAGTLTLTVAPI